MLPHLEAISRLGNEIKEKGAQLLHVSDESLQAGLDDIALLFLELQKWNRATLIHTKSIKSTTSEYKQVMDRTFLNLQNLNYERLHIQREIDNCRDFESIFQNVDLISEEDFRALFPHMSDWMNIN
ncbi:Fms-interacting protein-domain-containing protein [Chytridium lagenaria]|nr:Fms-interacting protein-domain-containing protein [Chytridium lagenaria]